MPRNSSGVYTLPSGNPVVPGTTIDAAWANDTMEDMANELTNSLSRTGAGGMLAPFRIADGAVTGPGLSYLNETNTGLYRSGAGSTWMAVLGVNTAQFSTVGLTIPFGKTLTAQGNASVNGTLSVTGGTTLASFLAVGGAITATGGVIGNVTAASGTSTFNNVTINGNLDMDAGSSGTITNLPNPVNPGDAANKAYVDAQDALRLALTGGTMTGAIAMSNNKVTGVATPTGDQDAATKAYVDSLAQGIDAKASCAAATTGNVTLSGTQTIDGYALTAGQRVLVKDQSAAADNGIYVVAAGGWSRAADANTWDELVAAFTFVEHGTNNANNGYICTIPVIGTLGTTPVTWAQFSGAGQITAGTGMSKTGNTLNVNTASSARIIVGADDIDLAATGVTASTYKSVTVDAYGRVTGGTNPTTLSGFGIGDAYTQAQTDTLLAAKLSTTGGTMTGAIAMGTSKITGMGDPTNAQDAATKNYIDTIFGSTASAATSASSASSSASNASTSASNASTSAASALASLNTFRSQYLGSAASDPTVDGNGAALTAGDLYFNTTASEMRVYTGSAWLTAYLPATGYLALSGGTMTGPITFAGAQAFDGAKVTGNISGNAANVTGAVAVANGGTGQTTYTDGQLLIGNTTGNTLTKATLTAGTGISVTNGNGSITISATGSGTSKTWTSFVATGTYTVPSGISSIRVYAFGKGGNGASRLTNGTAGGGGGGGCAFGDIAVTAGQSVSVSISSGVAAVEIAGTTYFTANAGVNGTTTAGGGGGTASIHGSVTGGGAYLGGDGGTPSNYGGGGSSGSPLGNGYIGVNSGGGWGGAGGSGTAAGGGAGGAGSNGFAGGAGGAALANGPGIGRNVYNAFTDPLLVGLISTGAKTEDAGAGGGGGGGQTASFGGVGGMGGGGGGSSVSTASARATGGGSAFGGGGGGAFINSPSGSAATGGSPTYAGGGGGAVSAGTVGGATGGTGGAAIVLIYA